MIKTLLLVGSGGFLGSVSRYFLQSFVNKQTSTDFPWGTFCVNVLGCLVIGCVYALTEKYTNMSNQIRLFFAVGFCGGFTTFSSFAMDKLVLMQNNQILHFISYIMLSVGVGFFMVWLGLTLTRNLI